MNRIDIEALKLALTEAIAPGGGWSARKLSLSVSDNPDLVRDLLRGKIKTASATAIVGFAKHLKRDLADFVPAASSEDISDQPRPSPTKERLKVVGAVNMGNWRDQTYWDDDEQYWIDVGPSPVRGAERFGLRSEGLSMDRTIPPGSDLECLRVQYGRVEPVAGDLVIVERHDHGRTELTCKRLDIDEEGSWILRCESSRPEFQDPIYLGKPDADLFIDNEIMVIGIVVSSQQNHFRRR